MSGKGTNDTELSILLQVTRSISSTLDYDQVLREIARAAGDALGSPECIIWEYEPVERLAVYRCLWEREPTPGVAAGLEGSAYPMKLQLGGIRGVQSGLVTQQSLSDPDLSAADRADMLEQDEKTWLNVPLVFGDAIIGIMILIETERERRFTDRELRLARMIGEQASVALHNARHHRREEERNRWLSTLVEASRTITSTLDAGTLLHTVAQLAAEAMLSPLAFIYEYDADDEVLLTRAAHRSAPGGRQHGDDAVVPLTERPHERAALEGGDVAVATVADAALDPAIARRLRDDGEQTLLAVPFRFHDETLGLLVLIETVGDRRFTRDEVEFMRAFGEQAAIALNNARLYASIEAQATRDALTGLANHRVFYDRLRHELAEAERYGSAVSLLMLDLDDFKALNDTYGHPAGDEVLRQIGEILAGEVRHDVDLPARYGGEEFAVILPHTGAGDGEACPDGAACLAARLRAAIRGRRFALPDGRTARTTVSIGIASYPASARGMDDLVARADVALYAAKRTGKDRVETA